MRYRRILTIIPVLILGCTELMGCRCAGQFDTAYRPVRRVPITTMSFRSSRCQKSECVQNCSPVDAIPSPDVVPDESSLMQDEPLSSLYMPPALLETPELIETPEFAPPEQPQTQTEFVKSLTGQIDGPANGPVQIDLSGTNVTDEDLKDLPATPLIDQLDLSITQITDTGLEELKLHKDLKLLRLDGTECTDAGVASLLKFHKLEFLGLSKTSLSDAGLKELSASKSLRYLLLDQTNITDEGLIFLESMNSLEGLSLLKTSISKEAVERFKQRLPHCAIIYEERKPEEQAAINLKRLNSFLSSPQQYDLHPSLTVKQDRECLQETELTSLTEVARFESEPEHLPEIHPQFRSHITPQQPHDWVSEAVANQNGWLGARQSVSPVQAAARVGFTTTSR